MAKPKLANKVYVKGLCMLYKCKTIHPRKKKNPRQGRRRKIRESRRGGIPSSWMARHAMGVSCIDYISMTMKDSALNDE